MSVNIGLISVVSSVGDAAFGDTAIQVTLRRRREDRAMLRRQSVTVIRLSSSHVSRPRHYYRHQPLSVRTAIRPTTRASHHPTNLPQIYPRSPSPSRKNSTLSSSKTASPSRRMRFVRRFVETVLILF